VWGVAEGRGKRVAVRSIKLSESIDGLRDKKGHNQKKKLTWREWNCSKRYWSSEGTVQNRGERVKERNTTKVIRKANTKTQKIRGQGNLGVCGSEMKVDQRGVERETCMESLRGVEVVSRIDNPRKQEGKRGEVPN